MAALQDRGHVLVFQPSAAEVHRKEEEWFKDPEIWSFDRGDEPLVLHLLTILGQQLGKAVRKV